MIDQFYSAIFFLHSCSLEYSASYLSSIFLSISACSFFANSSLCFFTFSSSWSRFFFFSLQSYLSCLDSFFNQFHSSIIAQIRITSYSFIGFAAIVCLSSLVFDSIIESFSIFDLYVYSSVFTSSFFCSILNFISSKSYSNF